MNPYGVIIGRMQPIHKGHIELIEQAANENDNVLILLGSANKLNERNPIPIKLRHKLVEESIRDYDWAYKVKVVDFDDLSSEADNSHDWGFYIYAKVVENIKYPYFTIYYSDGHEIITQWFPSFMLHNYISLKLNARGSMHEGLSATEIRNYIKNRFENHPEFANVPYERSRFLLYVSKPVYDNLYKIYKCIKKQEEQQEEQPLNESMIDYIDL